MIKFYHLVIKITKLFGFLIIRNRPSNSPEKQLSVLLNFLKVDLIFDIGANEGQFSRSIRQEKYQGKIVSFEPLSIARKKLNNYANKDDNWIIHEQCALGNENGKITINISKNSVSSSILPIKETHTDAAKDSIFVGSEIVTIKKLDDIANNYIESNSNLFVKIDSQGYEKEILKGAVSTLKKAKGILCELSLVPLYEGQFLYRDIIDYLEKHDFILWALQKGFTNPKTGQTFQMDGIFIKKTEIVRIKNHIDEKK